MAYVLGLDIGTGSLAGLVFNREGTLIDSASAAYPLEHPQVGYSEQNPADWVEAAAEVIEQLSQKIPDFQEELSGMSLSGQMHSLVLLDKEKEVLRPAILWNDVRNSEQCDRLMKESRGELLKMTKNIALEGFTLPKILWVQDHEPTIWEQTAHILLPKDYVRYWLTGNLHMDYSDAAGTLLLDMQTKEWSRSIAEKYQIPFNYLPELTESIEQTGHLREDLKNRFGFQQDVKIFSGGADNACSAVGSGIVSDDIAMASIGTSGVFLGTENVPLENYEGKLHLFHHAVPDSYYSMGVTLAAGNSLDWYKNTFASDSSYNELLKNIDQVEVGSNGLLFTPYIVGERTPHIDSYVRGSFIGIDTSHTRDHFTRAVVEGITFSLKETQELMKEVADKEFNKIISVGGGAKNKAWQQIQADIFNTPVTTLQTAEGPGTGAAMIAAVGLGWYDDFASCTEAFVSYAKEVVEPLVENAQKYEEIFDLYKEVYPATKNLSKKLLNM